MMGIPFSKSLFNKSKVDFAIKLTSFLLVFAMLIGCSFVNRIRLVNANNDLLPQWPSGQNVAELKAFYMGEKPYVEVSINGVSGFKFLVDTGASITILQDTDKVKQLKLSPGYSLSLGGWGDEERSPAFQSVLESLELSGVDFEKVTIAYLPVAKTKYFLRPDEAVYDGVLGHDILRHFYWRFDKVRSRIEIGRDEYSLNGKEVTIPFDISFSKLYIDSSMHFDGGESVNNELIIDTGSRHYVKLNAGFLRNNDVPLPKQITAVDFGLSGRAVHQRIRLAQLSLGKQPGDILLLENVKANLIESDDEDDFWVIGSALLNQFESIVDYHNNQLHLIPYSDHSFRTRFNLLGLELRKIKSGQFVVRYVFPELPAANVDIEEGDLIQSINGKPTTEISQEEWLELSATPEKYEICRERVKITCLELTSKHIPGYSMAISSK